MTLPFSMNDHCLTCMFSVKILVQLCLFLGNLSNSNIHQLSNESILTSSIVERIDLGSLQMQTMHECF